MAHSTVTVPQPQEVVDLTVEEIAAPPNISASVPSNQDAVMRSPASSVEEPLALRRSNNELPQQGGQTAHNELVAAMESPASSVEEPLIRLRNVTTTGAGVSYDGSRKAPDPVANQNGLTAIQAEVAKGGIEPGSDVTMEEDGLMSEEDCVAAVFEEDEEKDGEHTCNLCL